MSNVGRSNRFTKASPCPVCGGSESDPRGQSKRCSGFASDDGAWVRCTREEYAGSLELDDRVQPPAYRHLMRGECRCGQTHGPAVYTDEIEATYDYCAEDGKLLYQVVRKRPKKFLQRRPGMSPDTWEWNLQGVRPVPYRLPELLRADTALPVYIVEGEKDVHSLERDGLLATCNSGGAGKWKSCAPTAALALKGRNVYVVADADDAGRKHARQVAEALRGHAGSVTLLEAPPGHKDMSDAMRAGLGVQDCVPLTGAPLALVTPQTMGWEDSETPGAPDPGARDADDRPEVRLYAAEVAKNVDALDEAMAKNDDGVYQRAGELVQVVVSVDPGRNATGTPILHELEQYALAARISRRLRCVRFQPPSDAAIKLQGTGGPRAEGEWVPTVPSATQALLPFLKVRQWRHILPIRAVAETPVFRPDGTVMQAAGYDAATGYLYRPSCVYPVVPDQPTQDDARAAYAELQHVFCDFPYDTPASATVPIAALLTVLARAAIDGPTPAFIFDASVRGSGKTLQGKVVHSIAFGRSAAVAGWPEKPEDAEKLMGCYALDASPVAFFDNVKGKLGGPALEMALTSTVVEFRVLGRTHKPRLNWVSVVFVSGNNVELTDDMVRRSLKARLEPQEGDPETRTGFAHDDLPAWVTAERPRLVVAALTMLRAYACHGYPAAGGVMQSFLEWSRIIPGAIRFAGGADVLEARCQSSGGGQDEVGAVSVILSRAGALLPDSQAHGLSSKNLIDALYPPPRRDDPPDGFDDVREAVEQLSPLKGAAPASLHLGKALSRHVGRWIDGRRLVSYVSRGTRKWRIENRQTNPTTPPVAKSTT